MENYRLVEQATVFSTGEVLISYGEANPLNFIHTVINHLVVFFECSFKITLLKVKMAVSKGQVVLVFGKV